jgi:hypothetical protein
METTAVCQNASLLISLFGTIWKILSTKMAQKPKRGSPISEEKKMVIDYLDAHPDLKT